MRRTLLRPAAGIVIGGVLTSAGMGAGLFLFVLMSRFVSGMVGVPPQLWLLSWVGLLVFVLIGGGAGMLAGYAIYWRLKSR